jgi:hypothetical protein
MAKESVNPENVPKKEEKPYIEEKKSPEIAENLQKLLFFKLKIPRLIPFELIESVKGRTFSPEQFYVYQESQVDNPFNHLFVLVDGHKKIHGYLWAEVNVLDSSLFVNTFSISKEYWGKGDAIELAINFLRTLKEKTKSPRVFWVTTNEKFFIKKGFSRSKNILLEYNLD